MNSLLARILSAIFIALLTQTSAVSQSFYNLNTGWGYPVTFLDINFINNSIGWLVGSNGVILKTTDGGINWSPQVSYTNESIHTVIFFDELNGICLSESKVIKTTNGGTTWAIINNNFHNQAGYFTSDLIGYVSSSNYLAKTTNGGINWTGQFVEQNINDIFFISESIGYFAGKSGLLGQTTNSGSTWGRTTNSAYSFLALDVISQNLGWVVGENGVIFKFSNFYTLYQQQSNVTQSLVSVDFINANEGWVLSKTGRILKTTNAGSQWIIDEELYADSLVQIKVYSPENIWIVGKEACYTNHTGIFSFSHIPDMLVSFDSAVSITANAIGLPAPQYLLDVAPTGMEINQQTGLITWQANNVGNNLVIVRAYNNYGFMVDSFNVYVSEPSAIKFENDNKLKYYVLSQNYPNPFNPVTAIDYYLPVYSHIKITLYNILGQELNVLLNKEMPPGNHKLEIDAYNLNSGVYYYNLKTESTSITKKMTVIK